ncbi:hypothetical protein CPB84DRAFT_1754681, partial [Gymnopilus junonius]
NPAQDALSAPIVGARKDNRGFFHRDTARALTPLRLIAQFDANPQVFMAKVQNGTILMTVKEYPSFLYPAGTVYNQEDPAAGLFQGATFIRALRTIYTGNSSALDGYRVAPKDSQAEINGMTEVHFSLSDVATWADIDRSPFRYYNFYLKCMQLFADPDDEWVKETLEFLTSQIPSLKRRKEAREREACQREDNERCGQEREEGCEEEEDAGEGHMRDDTDEEPVQGPTMATSSSNRSQPPLAPPPPASVTAVPSAPSASTAAKMRKGQGKKRKPRY